MKNTGKNQLIDSLESRRLMSLTAGFESPAFSPPPPPGQMEHVFGFEQALPQMSLPTAGSFGPPLPPGGFFAGVPSPAWLQSAIAHAIATGTSVEVPPAEPVSSSNTLSALYSSLPTSTAIQIDTATLKSAAAALDDSVAQSVRGDYAPRSTSLPSSPSGSTAAPVQPGFSAARDQVGLDSSATSTKALAQAMSVVVKPISTIDTGHAPAPSWASLRKLEEDLSAVRALAGAVVAELGRESAIALSHLESIAESPAADRFVSCLTSWRSAAAITGAVIAAVAYTQNESGHEKEKKPVFSNRLISQSEM